MSKFIYAFAFIAVMISLAGFILYSQIKERQEAKKIEAVRKAERIKELRERQITDSINDVERQKVSDSLHAVHLLQMSYLDKQIEFSDKMNKYAELWSKNRNPKNYTLALRMYDSVTYYGRKFRSITH